MARKPRHILPGYLTEITLKTFQARFLLSPNPLLNRLVVGVFAMAQMLTGLEICAVIVMSNHLHLLCVPDSEHQLMRFCQYIGSSISKEVGKLRNWTGGIFRRRYSDIVVTHEPGAQVARLRYLLSHGVKESLCRRPQDWPGVNSVTALLSGQNRLEGIWIDRTSLWEANRKATRKKARRGKRPRTADHTDNVVLHLSKLPVWRELSDEAYRAHVKELIDEILDEFEEERMRAPKNPREALVEQPEYRPQKTKSSPKPECHAASTAERRRFLELRREFLRAYSEASALLREGVRRAIDLFPDGSFLPPIGLHLLVQAEPTTG